MRRPAWTVFPLREEIEAVNRQIQDAQQKYDLNKAAELQYGKLPQLQKELQAEEEKVKNAGFGPGARERDRG